MSSVGGVITLVLVFALFNARRAAAENGSGRPSTEDYITQYRINADRYRVTTVDGYRLTLFRLKPLVTVRAVALLQHGNRQTSADWLILNSNLPLQLLSNGVEVWLANSRLSSESSGHTSIKNTSAEFWNFSFHEIGYYDLASMVDAVLSISKQKRLHLIGYSEGSTAALILLAERPEYGAKVISLNLMAPAAFMGHSTYKPIAQTLTNVRLFAPWLYAQLHVNNYVNGSTRKQLEHYGQLILSGRFRQYDYGSRLNKQMYGSEQPPDYPLNRITTPTVLHYGDLDSVVHPMDVKQLGQELGRTTSVQVIGYETLQHTDFLSRKIAAQQVYPNIVKNVAKYR
ncbi:lipase 1-like [Wyeomyia smithii]|uniref:lipase 1-like n=1 Tax=Wyeomyia smithii TaxID=174621 RepID=UPI002467BF7E|nr:lipase 1-like [Wyeomyia smithii]